jgi:hypothetical protein
MYSTKMEDFRSPKYLEKYEFRPYELETPLQRNLGNNETQERRELRFLIDYPIPIDWYHSWIEVAFTVNRLDTGANYAANTNIAPCCGVQSFVNKLQVLANGITVYEGNKIGVGLFIKGLLLFSKAYAETTAKASFWALDTADVADRTRNEGFKWRSEKILSGGTVNAMLPLHCFSFFDSLHDKVLPATKMELRFTLEGDDDILWRAAAVAAVAAVGDQAAVAAVAAVPRGRLIITKFKLWAKTMVFSGVEKNLFKPLKWTYLTETVEESPQFQQTSGSWVITPQAFKPRHVYIGFMRANRKSNQERNPFIFDSCDLRSCQLEFGNRRYPDTQYDNSETARIYNDILGGQSSAFNRSSQLTPDLLQSCYPLYYFDLRYREEVIDSTSQKLIFSYTLAAAGQPYHIIAFTLSEARAEIAREGRDLIVTR